MRSDGVGPKCNDPHLIRRPLTTGRSQLRDVGGRDWREAAVSPGTPQVAGSAGRKASWSHPWRLQRVWPHGLLYLRLVAPGLQELRFCGFSSQLVGSLLWQPRQIHTAGDCGQAS